MISDIKTLAMTIEEYKEAIVKKLGKANDCEEVEQLLSRSIEKMKEKHLHVSVIADYLRKLLKCSTFNNR